MKTIRHWWRKLKKPQINKNINNVLGLEKLIFSNASTTQRNLWIQYNPYQNTNDIFHRTKKIPKIYIETPKTPSSQSKLRKKNKSRGIMLPDFKIYHKAIVSKTVWYWHKNRQRSIEQNRELRNKPILIWSINLWQRKQEYTTGKRDLSSLQQRCWEKWTASCKRIKLDHYFTPYKKLTQNGLKTWM